MKKLFVFATALAFTFPAIGQEHPTTLPPLVHSRIGDSVRSTDGMLTIKLIDKKQNYPGGDAATRDTDIHSPKSVNIHPDGTKYYVNSLEGGTTVCYDFKTGEKKAVIRHNFKEGRDDSLWASPSGLYHWQHYSKNLNTFFGKPVESTFSHNGRYLWVPYYRRSFDINAQDPSAIAVIDTKTDQIVRLLETGPLPKMIATSPDGNTVAVSHWGNNTIGLIDISSENPKDWKHKTVLVVDYVLLVVWVAVVVSPLLILRSNNIWDVFSEWSRTYAIWSFPTATFTLASTVQALSSALSSALLWML